MSVFTVSVESSRSPEDAWERLVDWPAHGRFVPLTRVTVPTPPPNGVGTRFVARTAVGRFGFDDPMEIVGWQPPTADTAGECRIEKRGRVMLGWAVLRVEPRPSGCFASWTEEIHVHGLPRVTDPATAASSRLLFGRVLRQLLA